MYLLLFCWYFVIFCCFKLNLKKLYESNGEKNVSSFFYRIYIDNFDGLLQKKYTVKGSLFFQHSGSTWQDESIGMPDGPN